VTPNPGFKVTVTAVFHVRNKKWNISKRCVLGTKLLKNTNRKLHTIYRMVPLSVTSDPDFKVATFLDVEYLRNDST